MSEEKYGKAKLCCAIITAAIAIALMVISYGEFRGEVKGHGERLGVQSKKIADTDAVVASACQRISVVEGQLRGIDGKLEDLTNGQDRILNILLQRNNNLRGTKE